MLLSLNKSDMSSVFECFLWKVISEISNWEMHGGAQERMRRACTGSSGYLVITNPWGSCRVLLLPCSRTHENICSRQKKLQSKGCYWGLSFSMSEQWWNLISRVTHGLRVQVSKQQYAKVIQVELW